MPDLHCPSCDRRLTPDHRCLSRRVFLFGAMAGIVAKLAGDVGIDSVVKANCDFVLPLLPDPPMIRVTDYYFPGAAGIYRMRKIGNLLTPPELTSHALLPSFQEPMALPDSVVLYTAEEMHERRIVNLKEPG